ncbi:MAG: alpha/beta fold hydrolase, partial [Ramlibacter sp.]
PNALRQLWAAARYRAPDRPPAVPLLLLASAGDRLVHPSCSARLADRWEVPLRLHPWAGHDLPLDDPAWVLDHVLSWSAAA